ncbi:MAG: GTPase HflX [Bryobacterales bacterium]|nr:GTPase HflX [Bryobacterales bacterium]
MSTAKLQGIRRVALPRDEDEAPERCILAGLHVRTDLRRNSVAFGSFSAEESIAELAELAAGAGAEVLGHCIQVRDRPVPATLLGSGKLREIHGWAAEAECDFVLFDHDLTASQHRNLERELDRPVLDRTQLILDIFARHARSREGRLQVELAQLEYMLPRLAGRGTAMSRLGGGIGTRGPGETQLESDRRKIRRRLAKLRSDLNKVRATRRLHRAKRTSVPIPTVALCGYTNAGKSTLFNALTRANVLADPRLFATLDPTLRRLELPSNRRALLSDTVGFIRNLPPALIQAFRATLEEVTEADLLVHVVDVSAEHRRVHREQVDRVLDELDASGKPQLLVLNKCDLLDRGSWDREIERERFSGSSTSVVAVSARTGVGLGRLLATIDGILAAGSVVRKHLRLPYSEGRVLAMLYRRARVLDRRDGDAAVEVEVELTPMLADRLERYSCHES